MCILGYYMLFGSLSQDEREVIVTSHGLHRDTKCSINSFYTLDLDVFICKCFMENLKSWFGDLTGGRLALSWHLWFEFQWVLYIFQNKTKQNKQQAVYSHDMV